MYYSHNVHELRLLWEIFIYQPAEFKAFLLDDCRYYYDKNIILKTAGKRYVYRFVCDLQGLLGYSPEEIHQMVDLKIEKKEED